MTAVVSFLEAKRERIAGLEGAEVDVMLGLFSDNTQLNCVIPASMMGALSAMNVDLLVSGYVSSDS